MRAWLQIVLRTQPLVPAAVLFILGIVAARLWEPSPLLLLTALATGLALFRWTRLAGGALLILTVGAVIYWARYAPFSEDDLRILLGAEPALAKIRGTLTETPMVREFSSREFTTARLRVSEIQLDGRWRTAHGEVMTRTRGALADEFFEGRRVEVAGLIRQPPGAQAPGLFDYREYLRNTLVFYQLEVERVEDWIATEPQTVPFIERLRRWARWQLSRGVPQDEQLSLLWAMTLGWKSSLSGEMAEPFMRSGTMHIIAISGLHVACIAGMLVFAMRLFGLPRFRCALVVIPLVWLYTIATGWQSSGVRSALMSSALIAGWSLMRPTRMLNSMAAAALLILLFRPEQLFQAGFQLSFVVVASIALFAPMFERGFAEKLPFDPFLPRELRPRWHKLAEYLYRCVRPSIIVSLACFLGSLPLVAYYFNLFTPVSLVANLFAVPVSSLSLLFSMLSLVLFPLGEFFNILSWCFMWETIWLAHAFAIPGGYFYVSKPGAAFFVFYFAFFLALCGGLLWRRETRLWTASGLMLAAGAWLISARANPALHVLPAPGAPVWIDLPATADDLLIDCSNAYGFEFSLKRFLRGQGLNRVPNLLLTHGDIEHIGGFTNVLTEFAPGTVYTGPHPSRSPAHRQALKLLEQMPQRWRQVQRGDVIAGWTVLHPTREKFPRADDNSVVMKTEIEGWRVLYLGDLGRDGQRALLNADLNLSADVVIIGNSAGGEPVRDSLVEAIGAKVAIFSDPPKAPWLGLMFNTEEDGAVSIEFTPRECRIAGMSGKRHVLERL